jgi:hypothetical protein
MVQRTAIDLHRASSIENCTACFAQHCITPSWHSSRKALPCTSCRLPTPRRLDTMQLDLRRHSSLNDVYLLAVPLSYSGSPLSFPTISHAPNAATARNRIQGLDRAPSANHALAVTNTPVLWRLPYAASEMCARFALYTASLSASRCSSRCFCSAETMH